MCLFFCLFFNSRNLIYWIIVHVFLTFRCECLTTKLLFCLILELFFYTWKKGSGASVTMGSDLFGCQYESAFTNANLSEFLFLSTESRTTYCHTVAVYHRFVGYICKKTNRNTQSA